MGENNNLITIKQLIMNDNITKQYINDYYIPTSPQQNQLIKPKLLYDFNEHDENINDSDYNNNQTMIGPTNMDQYYINEELNEGFGNKVIRLLRIIIDNEQYNNSEITFERLKHKKYGKHNEVIANGIYYIWHCHGLQRSFALEEQTFTSFLHAMSEEYGFDPDDDKKENINDNKQNEKQNNDYNHNHVDIFFNNINDNDMTNNINNNNLTAFNTQIGLHLSFDASPSTSPKATTNTMTPLTPMCVPDPNIPFSNVPNQQTAFLDFPYSYYT